jgi:hypothetical protein
MKRLHQLLAGLLAVATVCAVSLVPAFAEEVTATASPTFGSSGTTGALGDGTTVLTTLPVTSVYEITNAGLMPEGKFTYTLTPAAVPSTVTDSGAKQGVNIGKENDQSVEASSVEITFDSKYLDGTTALKRTMTADIPLYVPAGTTSGKYFYTLTQTNTGVANKDGTYDKKSYTVELTVNGDAQVVMAQVYNANGVKVNPVYDNKLTNEEYLVVRDYVTTKYDTPKAFTFHITIPAAGNAEGVQLTKGTEIIGTKYDADDNKIGTVTITVTDTYDATKDTSMVVCDGFTLANGEYVEFTGLPTNMKYFVNETDAQSDNYSSIYYGYADTNSDKVANESYNTSYATNATNTNHTEYNVSQVHYVEYINTRDIVATGVTMDTTPYVLMFVAAAGLAVLSLAKKKIVR